MSYKLKKPYTDEEYADFVTEYNHGQLLLIEETVEAIYALEVDEIMQNGKPIKNPNYETELKQQEAERIAKLTMTPLDFISFLVSKGLTLEQINAYLEANLDIKMQLTYRSDVLCKVACSFMPMTIGDITITEDMVITAFRQKHGEMEE